VFRSWRRLHSADACLWFHVTRTQIHRLTTSAGRNSGSIERCPAFLIDPAGLRAASAVRTGEEQRESPRWLSTAFPPQATFMEANGVPTLFGARSIRQYCNGLSETC
jgi:hypothetical protein